MPQFDITSPDGRKFRITAPEGATKEEVLDYYKNQTTNKDYVKRGEELRKKGGLRLGKDLTRQSMEEEQSERGPWDRFWGGAGGAVDRAAFALKDLATDLTPQEANRVLYGKEMQRSGAGAAGGLAANIAMTAPAYAMTGAGLAAMRAGLIPQVIGMGATGAATGALLEPEERGVAAVTQGLGAATGSAITGGLLSRPSAGMASQALTPPAGKLLPLTTRSQVGSALAKSASDPSAAQRNLSRSGEIIPGSLPTVAQASKDPGLAILERGIQSSDPRVGGLFADRLAQQNSARLVALDKIAGDTKAVDSAKLIREQLVGPIYQQVLSNPVKVTPRSPEGKQIASIMKRLEDTPALAKARQIAKLEGIDVKAPAGDIRGLHYVKMALDDLIDRPFDSGIGRTEQRALIGLREDLLKVMEKVQPNYELARGAYATGSAPINQMETLQDIRGRTLNAGTTSSGENLLSQAKWFNVVTKNKDELSKVLTPDQMQTLEKIGRDLDRGQLWAVSGKAPGSNTTQNLSTLMGTVLGGKLSLATQSLSWLMRLKAPERQALMAQAMLDPKLAAQLMQEVTPKRIEQFSLSLQQKANAMQLGANLGAQTPETVSLSDVGR